MEFTKIKDALEYIGGMSKPSKMPCPSYSIPAKYCKVGSCLREVAGSVCADCYGCKGMYRFPCVKDALERRFATLDKDGWVDAFVFILTKRKAKYFRFHDVGDVQSLAHLMKIVEIAKRCPDCKIWLPTNEKMLVASFVQQGHTIPENLTIRLSSTMIDGDNATVKEIAKDLGCVVSSVSRDKGKVNCLAIHQDGECKDCRACWDKNVKEIVYIKH